MSPSATWTERRARAMNRLHAAAASVAPGETGFRVPPEPRIIGSLARGRRLVAGRFEHGGASVVAPGGSPWTLPRQGPAFEAWLHGFGWLDDLAAVGDPEARAVAQAWVTGWIRRFGRGNGPGWEPGLTGRRVVRMLDHAGLVLGSRDETEGARYFRSLAGQTAYLARRWPVAAPGLRRIEALAGLVTAALVLRGMEGHVGEAVAALGGECTARIDAGGGIASRNPEELLEIFTDGGLARFHGGGRGAGGRLDHALAVAGVRGTASGRLAMGFARLAVGRTSVIVDAAAAPQGAASAAAHASTLAFEFTSARRQLIVNCGSGRAFGLDWWRAGRATSSHSTLGIDGVSSSRLAAGRRAPRDDHAEWFADGPRSVQAHLTRGGEGPALVAGHDGYVATHGLTHVRRLGLASDGRSLAGEDTLGAMNAEDARRFERRLQEMRADAVRYSVRFHLHPDVEAVLDLGGRAVSLTLLSGEIWVFRHDGQAAMALQPSVYLDPHRPAPRESLAIVLTASVADYAHRVGWTLAKAQGTPTHIRDLGPGDDPEDA